MPIPQAVYFPEGDCTLQQEEVIRDLGIAAVIQYGSAYPADAPAGTLWYLEARAAYDSQNGNALLWAINNSTGMALTEGWQQPRELFSTEDFQQSLDFLVAYVAMGKAEVANVSQAWQQRFEAEQIRKAEEQSWLDRRESLVQRQAEIEQALRELGSKQ